MHDRDHRLPRASGPPLWIPDLPDPPEDALDYEFPRELSDEALAALAPDDDYEPLPDAGDVWIDQDND